MQPNSQRRVHGAEFKAQVLAECQRPGASVAAVALAHGLIVNLVRKWLVGRGLKRTGLVAPSTATCSAPSQVAPCAAPLQFVPVELAAAGVVDQAAGAAPAEPVPCAEPPIHIELHRGSAQLSVR